MEIFYYILILGFGPEYINYERKIEYSTAAKNAIKVKLKEENISEEMRILYVALTRAKEKLVITAVRNNEEKELEKKRAILEIYSKDKKINPILLKKYVSYLDWIELVSINSEIRGNPLDVFNFNIFKAKEFLEETSEEIVEEKEIDLSNYKEIEKIKEKLDWKYKDLFLTTLPIKTSVSKIKEIRNNKEEFGLEKFVPEFLKDEKIEATRKGTLIHLVLQKIDFNKIVSKSDIEEFLEYLKSKNFITDEESKQIEVQKIFDFLNSDFALKIKNAKKVYKEKQFCVKIKVKEFLEDAKDEELTVQGIIDLYYITNDGNVILVDYKTDYVQIGNEHELIKKYKLQLDIYRIALEEALGKNIEEVYIYSLCLNKEIKI